MCVASSLHRKRPVPPGCSKNAASLGAPPPLSFHISPPKGCLLGLRQPKATQTTSLREGGSSLIVPTSPSETYPGGGMGRQHQKRRLPRSCHHTRSNRSGGAISLPPARMTNVEKFGGECPFLAVIPIKWHPAGTRGLQTETSWFAPEPLSFHTSSYSLTGTNSNLGDRFQPRHRCYLEGC